MKIFSEYRKADGVFTSCVVVGMEPSETDSTAWKAGQFDHRMQRVDLSSGEVLAYDAPAPDRTREQKRRAQARIENLERQQLRPLRELALNPANAGATRRLSEIETEIAGLRSALARPSGAA